MRFLIDAQLPPALARWLVGQGHTASHVFDLGFERADDRKIWNYALTGYDSLVSKDEDFAVMSALEADGPMVVWVRFGNTSRRDVIARFERELPAIISARARNERLIEID